MAAEGVEARMAEGNVTTDHAKIRKWAEERGGVPATVKGTKSGGEPGLLRLDFEPQGRQLGTHFVGRLFREVRRRGFGVPVPGPHRRWSNQPVPQIRQPVLRAAIRGTGQRVPGHSRSGNGLRFLNMNDGGAPIVEPR